MGINFYDLAVDMLGVVPPQWEILYCFATIILFIGFICLVFSPVIVVKVMCDR